jgi:hypothetical protein
MCTGIEIALLAAGTAAAAGGAAMQRSEASSNAAAIAKAKNAELRASMERQRAYEKRSRDEGVQKALNRFAPEVQAQAQASETTRRDQAINDAVTATAGVDDIALPPTDSNAPTVVKDQLGKKLRDVFNTATERAKLAAKPLTFSDMLAANNIPLTEAGRVVDTGNSFARQEAAMLPAQQDFAAYLAQKTPSIWGPLLQAGGSALAGAAGSGYAGKLGGTVGSALAGTALPLALNPSSVTGRVTGPV